MRLFNLLGQINGTCAEECEAIDGCWKVPRINECSYQLQLPQTACYATSVLTFTLTCTGGNIFWVVTWELDGTHTATWTYNEAGTSIDCTCGPWTLFPDQVVTEPCDTGFSEAVVSFQRIGFCCNDCPQQMQVTLSDVGDVEPQDPKCDDQTCADLNGSYVLDFVQTGTTPPASCGSQLANSYCEWRYDFPPLLCVDEAYGFCSLHLFIGYNDRCEAEVIVELKYDNFIADDGPVCGGTVSIAWKPSTGLIAGLDCENMNQLCDFICLDTLTLCEMNSTPTHPVQTTATVASL